MTYATSTTIFTQEQFGQNMTNDDTLNYQIRPAIVNFEETIPIRGCKLSLESIKKFYLDLERINQEFGQSVVSQMIRQPEISDKDWEQYKELLRQDAFRLTITITGDRNQRVHGESSEVFSSENLPSRIDHIYFTNLTSYRRNADGSNPINELHVNLDFKKPELLDPAPLVSEATPNNSTVFIQAANISFSNSIRDAVEDKLNSRKNWFGFLHKNFSYDAGQWFVALPIILVLSTFYMEKWFVDGSTYAPYKWAFFIYASGLLLVAYRFLISYAKWAFPVNVLAENKDASWRHRLALGGIGTWTFYEVVDVLYNLAF